MCKWVDSSGGDRNNARIPARKQYNKGIGVRFAAIRTDTNSSELASLLISSQQVVGRPAE